MRENLEPQETVVHLWWEEFPDLFYDGHRQHFLWGLDPTYTARCAYKNYPAGKVAELLEKMRTQEIAIHPGWLADTFEARVLVMGHAPALRFAALTTGRWNPIYVDASSVIFALKGPQGPPPGFQAPLGPSHPPGTFAPRSLHLKMQN